MRRMSYRETRLKAIYVGTPPMVRLKTSEIIRTPNRLFDAGSVYQGLDDGGVAVTLRALRRVKTVAYLKWTKADQFEAVKRGYFIERGKDNHAIVITLESRPTIKTRAVIDGCFSVDRERPETDAEIMKDAMRLWRAGDGHAAHLIAFVTQQDMYKWVGVWDVAVETFTERLVWFKLMSGATPSMRAYASALARGRGRPRGPTGYAMKPKPKPETHAQRIERIYGEAPEPYQPPKREEKRKARYEAKKEAADPQVAAQQRALRKAAGIAKRRETARYRRDRAAWAGWMAGEFDRLGSHPEVSFDEWREAQK